MTGFGYQSIKKIDSLPKETGVYCFSAKASSVDNHILYIGKALNIKNRVKNHFQQPTQKDQLFLRQIKKIGYIKTRSEIEALIIEAALIKKYRPKFNIIWKDDKNYFYIAITKEAFPRIFITHQPNKKKQHSAKTNTSISAIGPFVDGQSLKNALRALRKILGYRTCRIMPKKTCLYFFLKACPGPCINKIKKEEYRKNIHALVKIFNGKRDWLIKKMKKEMSEFSRRQKFEEAAEVRNKLFLIKNAFEKSGPLQKIRNRKLPTWDKTRDDLQTILRKSDPIKRIEAYDISNIQGQQATGSMIVFKNGAPDKSQYRKFKIKISGKPNDTAMIREVLERRLRHREWKYPSLMLIDGGKPQLSAALKEKKRGNKTAGIKILAIAKRNNELFVEGKAFPLLLSVLPRNIFNLILHMRDEAHRFAIGYHKKLRNKQMIEG